MIKIKSFLFKLLIITLFSLSCLHADDNNDDAASRSIISSFQNLTKSSQWQLVSTVKQKFQTYHPQGMVKIGDFIYLSAVEKIINPERFDSPQNGFDRTPGKGKGHLFKADLNGNLIDQITFGEGLMYHPGGIDYDGTYIWCPVAEYRPNSASIIYRVHPDSLKPKKMFQFNDHIGAVIYNRENNTLHGMSWGSRRFYVWNMDDITQPNQLPEYDMHLNGNHYIAYQDCHYLGDHYALCSGLSQYIIPDVGKIAMGGVELLDLKSHIAIHQIPVQFWVKPDLVMSNNPFFVEFMDDHLRCYFIPEDDNSTLYIYEVNH